MMTKLKHPKNKYQRKIIGTKKTVNEYTNKGRLRKHLEREEIKEKETEHELREFLEGTAP